MELFEFEIPAHTTRREWAVYVIVARHRQAENKIFYVGKVGDNRAGCNPMISRIGNHFSHNEIHSQMRNKILEATGLDTTEYDYKVVYSTFGKYVSDDRLSNKDKINELERQLNTYIQQKTAGMQNVLFLNPYGAVGVSKSKKAEQLKLLTEAERNDLEKLADRAVE